MSHFKYEIDERNLRLQLRSNDIPFSEDAWQKFEHFSTALKSNGGDEAIGRFSLSLNRNVILPVVFGGIIILFSLLLFNFINIKNPNAAREARAEVNRPEVTTAEPAAIKKQEPAPVQPAAELEAKAPAPDANTAADPAQPASAAVQNPAAQPASQNTPNTSLNTLPAKEAVVVNKPETPVVNQAANQAQAYASPVRQVKKRSAVVTEASAEEEEVAPPPVSEPAAEAGGLK